MEAPEISSRVRRSFRKQKHPSNFQSLLMSAKFLANDGENGLDGFMLYGSRFIMDAKDLFCPDLVPIIETKSVVLIFRFFKTLHFVTNFFNF